MADRVTTDLKGIGMSQTIDELLPQSKKLLEELKVEFKKEERKV